MRKRVFIFLLTVLGGLLIAPLVNVLSHPNVGMEKWRERENLYNLDFASQWPNFLLYQLGISTHPEQIVIGREGWLYLGDNYAQSRTVNRNGQTPADLVNSQKIGAASQAWEIWLKNRGVRLFRVMVGPDKESIYPEYLPTWARPAATTATDALIAGTGTDRYIDLRASLMAAKATHPEALYYKTDTHWNELGAGAAFLAFARSAGRSAPELRWPMDAGRVTGMASRKGGDLSGFLRIQGRLTESEPLTAILGRPVEVTQYDFDTRQMLQKGGNPKLASPQTPLLVISEGALNARKVLWLRDSFGEALAPLMAATFSETVQLYWQEALKPDGRFTELVEKWKPDYVFITVVERDSRSDLFALSPPLDITGPSKNFKPVRASSRVGMNDIVEGKAANEYHLKGADPFVEYALDPEQNMSRASFLNLKLTCDDGTTKVPMQLFWLKDGERHYKEEQSVRFEILSGAHLIDLRSVPGWPMNENANRIRLDIDSKGACVDLKLVDPVLGLIAGG